jgi:hypothetical protein
MNSETKQLTKDEAISEIVYDDYNIEDVVTQAPQTYNTILQHLHKNGTLLVILKRRISRLKKQGRLLMTRIPGTRFGMCLFMSPKHEYKVLILHTTIKVRVFYMYDFKTTDKEVILENYWELTGSHMDKWTYSDEPLSVKRYALRDGGFILWD